MKPRNKRGTISTNAGDKLTDVLKIKTSTQYQRIRNRVSFWGCIPSKLIENDPFVSKMSTNFRWHWVIAIYHVIINQIHEIFQNLIADLSLIVWFTLSYSMWTRIVSFKSVKELSKCWDSHPTSWTPSFFFLIELFRKSRH